MSFMYLQVLMPRYINHILSFFFLLAANARLNSQPGACPTNIDFELGDLTSWECKTGQVDNINGINTVTWQNLGVNALNHKIIPRATAGTDQYGGFSEASPNGSAYSVRLGNNYFQNVSAESMSYTFSIPADANMFSILFYYAVVFQDPQHTPEEQPRFRTSLYNVTDNQLIDCSNFDFTASASLPGFRTSTVDPSVIYKDWTPVTLNLSRFAGKTIRLEFITSDCTFKGHFGYAYIDVNTSCSSAIQGDVICPGAASATFTAPHGFQTYAWYSDETYSTVLSNSQTITLTPVPPAGTSLPVVVGPYPGFGCPDTIKSLLRIAVPPVADAGADISFCNGTAARLGADPVPGNLYSWSPAALLTATNTASTLTIPTLSGPTSFYLMVTNSESGCTSYDTVQVTPVNLDTAMRQTGDTIFCMNIPVNTTLEVLDVGASVQWFESSNAVGGATNPIFQPQPSATHIYWALLQKGQCQGSTRFVTVKKLPLPVAAIKADPMEQCVNGPFTFINSSTEQGATTYRWRLSDGRTAVTKNMTASFTTPGNYTAYLLAVSADGCADSTQKTVKVTADCGIWVPTAFTPGDNGRNDWFRPYFTGAPKLKRFMVYDRNGFVVFNTTKLGEGWDGRHKGVAVPTGVLVWTLEYITPEGKTVFEKGTVSIIR